MGFFRFAVAAAFLTSIAANAAEPLTLVDSNGVVMGPVAEYDSGDEQVRFPLLVENRRLLIRATVERYDKADIYFESTDCSGRRIMRFSQSEPQFFVPYVIGDPVDTLYIRDYSKPVKTLTAKSRSFNGFCSTTSITGSFAIAKATRDLSTIYTPPFKVVFGAAVETLP